MLMRYMFTKVDNIFIMKKIIVTDHEIRDRMGKIAHFDFLYILKLQYLRATKMQFISFNSYLFQRYIASNI